MRPFFIAFAFMQLVFALNAWAGVGTIQSVLGDARISQRSGLERPAQKGVQLQEGDTVVTAANSNVQIRMIDEAMIWMKPQSQLVIDKYNYSQLDSEQSKNQVALRLVQGGFRTVTGLIGRTNQAQYKVTSPNATIGIRGTDFDAVFVAPAGRSQFGNAAPGTYNRVYAGSTLLSGPSGQVTLNKDEAGFMGLQPGDKPTVLPSIPDFLKSTPAPAAKAESKAPRAMTLIVRLAELDDATSTSSASRSATPLPPVQRISIKDGDLARLSLPSAQIVEFMPRMEGNGVRLEFTNARQPANSYAVTLRPGQPTEVTGKGPWSENNVDTSSKKGARAERYKTYLSVEDALK